MVQMQIICKVLQSKDPKIIIDNDLTVEYFVGYEEYYNFIMNHYRRYGNIPDIPTFINKFDDFTIVEVYESDKYLVDTIREEYLYTQLVPILKNSAQKLTNDDAIQALDYLKSQLTTVTPSTSSYGVDIISQANERYEEYEQKQDSETPWYMPTGFKELDDIIGGLAQGEEFLVIVARTGQGKSWVLVKIAAHNWKMGFNVGYISPEMSANQIGYRFDTLNKHFSNSDLFKGNNIDGYSEYIKDLQENQKNKFIVATPMDFNKKVTVSKLRDFCIHHELNLLCIDGITYLADERYKKGDNKTTSLTNISEDLMALSCELKIPILAVVQSNRNGIAEEGTPNLEDIRDSDGIAHNASKVLSIRQRNNKLRIEVKKNRSGANGAKLAYDWDINMGTMTYNPNIDEYSETTEDETPSTNNHPRRSANNSNSVNKQPLTKHERQTIEDMF